MWAPKHRGARSLSVRLLLGPYLGQEGVHVGQNSSPLPIGCGIAGSEKNSTYDPMKPQINKPRLALEYVEFGAPRKMLNDGERMTKAQMSESFVLAFTFVFLMCIFVTGVSCLWFALRTCV